MGSTALSWRAARPAALDIGQLHIKGELRIRNPRRQDHEGHTILRTADPRFRRPRPGGAGDVGEPGPRALDVPRHWERGELQPGRVGAPRDRVCHSGRARTRQRERPGRNGTRVERVPRTPTTTSPPPSRSTARSMAARAGAGSAHRARQDEWTGAHQLATRNAPCSDIHDG